MSISEIFSNVSSRFIKKRKDIDSGPDTDEDEDDICDNHDDALKRKKKLGEECRRIQCVTEAHKSSNYDNTANAAVTADIKNHSDDNIGCDNNDNKKYRLGNAFDIIIIESKDHKLYQGSDFMIHFTRRASNPRLMFRNYHQKQRIVLEIFERNNNSSSSSKKINNSKDNETEECCSSKVWFPIIDDEPSIRGNSARSNDGGNNNEKNSTEKDDELNDGNNEHIINKNKNDNDDSGYHAGVDDVTSKLSSFLVAGKNPIRYLLLDNNYDDDNTENIIGIAYANIYLWSYNDSVIVSDIDGTITKSNAKGVIDNFLTKKHNHTCCHDNVSGFYSQLLLEKQQQQQQEEEKKANDNNSDNSNNKYETEPKRHVLYVTSRPLRLASNTRAFMNNMKQELRNDESNNIKSERLPEGPIIGFGGNFGQLVSMELVTKRTHHFKADILWQQIVLPFLKANEDEKGTITTKGFGNVPNNTPAIITNIEGNGDNHNHNQKSDASQGPNIFVAGFGNTMMDVMAYHMVGIELKNIYIINPKSIINVFDNSNNKIQQELQSPTEEDASSLIKAMTITNNTHDGNSSPVIQPMSSASSLSNHSTINGADKRSNSANSNKDNNDNIEVKPGKFARIPMPKRWYHNRSMRYQTYDGYSDPKLLLRLKENMIATDTTTK